MLIYDKRKEALCLICFITIHVHVKDHESEKGQRSSSLPRKIPLMKRIFIYFMPISLFCVWELI